MPKTKKTILSLVLCCGLVASGTGLASAASQLNSIFPEQETKKSNSTVPQKVVTIENTSKTFDTKTKTRTFVFEDKIEVSFNRKQNYPSIKVLDSSLSTNAELLQGKMFFGSDSRTQINENTQKVNINFVAVSAKTNTVIAHSWGKANVLEIQRLDLPPGLREGMDKMRVGEKRVLVFPKILLGYNNFFAYEMPDDDNIVFLVNLVSLKNAEDAQPILSGTTLSPPEAGTQQVVFPQNISAIPSSDTKLFGLHIPWALPLDYPIQPGEYNRWQGDWPNIDFGSIRLWDTRTTWSMLEPQKNRFSWRDLDGHVANAQIRNIKNITLVIGGTPTWAGSKPAPNSAEWLGPDSAAVPNEQDWINFLTVLATRYKGKISAYQIWNEPNSPLFWQGSPEELARLIAVARQTIKRIDPNAIIVSPGFAVSEKMSHNTTRKWWKAFAEASFPFDVAATHAYPSPTQGIEGFQSMLKRSKDIMKLYGWNGKVWVTEVSFLQREGDKTISPQLVRELVALSYVEARKENIEKMFWYAWMPEKGSGDNHKLLTMQNGSAGAAGFRDAYGFLTRK
jgi:hypothetical protein